MGDRVHIAGLPGPHDAGELLAVWREIFPAPGDYYVTPLAKADIAAGGAEPFEEWFLARLEEATRRHFVSAQYAIWEVLDDLLRRRGVRVPSEIDQYELNRTLFDLTHASTARMVGLRVPTELITRLGALGWTPLEALDFPALAYRVGRVYHELSTAEPQPLERLREMLASKPLSSIERGAIEHVQNRAGLYLRPIFDATGEVWTAEREIAPLRELTARTIAERGGARAAARELGKTNRAQGIIRDSERVMRTEIAEAYAAGNWHEHAKHWAPETKLFRLTSPGACKGCLRLLRNPDGTPRLYTRADFEAGRAAGVNRGGWRGWHLRVGPLHPNCVCGPLQEWHDAMRSIVADRAPEFAAHMERLGVFEEAA